MADNRENTSKTDVINSPRLSYNSTTIIQKIFPSTYADMNSTVREQ